MRICDWCNESFDYDEAVDIFDSEEGILCLSYSNIRPCLCGKCAVQAIEDKVDDVYYENCSNCGRSFDLIKGIAEFETYTGETYSDCFDCNYMCPQCATIEYDSENLEEQDEDLF